MPGPKLCLYRLWRRQQCGRSASHAGREPGRAV